MPRKAHNFKDISGQKFGRLMVLHHAESDKAGRAHWECRCECGSPLIVSGKDLRSGNTSSCGCLHRERQSENGLRHGHSRRAATSTEYNIWLNIKGRCLRPANPSYGYYGARGISICGRWRDSFEDFLADVGSRPSLKHSIDRINNDGNYEPGNVRWATRSQQMLNARKRARYARNAAGQFTVGQSGAAR